MPQPSPKPLPIDPGNPFVLVPLHQYPEFTFPCATLLNIEWPRSRQARREMSQGSPATELLNYPLELNSLWSCSRNFPVAMVLVQCDDRQAVGFCKISLIPKLEHACFLESVVIHPDLRGKGLGSLLMKKLEIYILSRKLKTVYLSTLGQEKFYKKLGYCECEPVSLYAFGQSSSLQADQPKSLENGVIALLNSCNHTDNHESLSKIKPLQNNYSTKTKSKPDTVQQQQCAPPPPPLPSTPIGKGVMTTKTFMKKDL